MKSMKLLGVTVTTAALLAAPAWALPGGVPDHGTSAGSHPQSHAAPTTGTPTHTTPSQAEAFGLLCKSESKKHVAGQKGTPFSQCVTAMAKAAHGASFKAACAALSKKHVAGQKGTPYSLCVSAAAKLQH